jgi:hypothetical protein
MKGRAFIIARSWSEGEALNPLPCLILLGSAGRISQAPATMRSNSTERPEEAVKIGCSTHHKISNRKKMVFVPLKKLTHREEREPGTYPSAHRLHEAISGLHGDRNVQFEGQSRSPQACKAAPPTSTNLCRRIRGRSRHAASYASSKASPGTFDITVMFYIAL